MGAECQGSPEGGDLCSNLRFNRLRLTSGMDEVAVTAFLLSGLKAVRPFLSVRGERGGAKRLKQPGGRVFPNCWPPSFITQVSVVLYSSPPGPSGGGVGHARKTLVQILCKSRLSPLFAASGKKKLRFSFLC